MKFNKASALGLVLAFTVFSLLIACGSGKVEAGVRAESGKAGIAPPSSPAEAAEGAADGSAQTKEWKTVTFIELGSVHCIPCKAMQPIMDELRAKYPDQVEVVFYDVWTAEGRPYGSKFGIRVIPTQVFLDAEGREFFRHEGFFPMEELVQVLAKGGVKP